MTETNTRKGKHVLQPLTMKVVKPPTFDMHWSKMSGGVAKVYNRESQPSHLFSSL